MAGPASLGALSADLGSAALLFDFDGTLSATVADPDHAEPIPGVVERLAALASRAKTVAVVSGRPVAFLVQYLPAAVAVSGQYGLERAEGGVVVPDPGAQRWEKVMRAAVADLEAGPPGLRIEPKGLTVTVHWRQQPHNESVALALAEETGRRHGLALHRAKASVELRPPVDADKGTEVRRLAEGSTGVLYVGDDVGDLPAFLAVHDLLAAGHVQVGLAVAVDGPELPAGLRAEADLVVDGPAGVIALVDALLAGAPR